MFEYVLYLAVAIVLLLLIVSVFIGREDWKEKEEIRKKNGNLHNSQSAKKDGNGD